VLLGLKVLVQLDYIPVVSLSQDLNFALNFTNLAVFVFNTRGFKVSLVYRFDSHHALSQQVQGQIYFAESALA
jgi:hypothetical protein